MAADNEMKGGFQVVRILVSCLLTASCVVFASGCGTVVGDELGWNASPDYTVLSEEQLEDIPAPSGFEVDRASKRSFSFAPKNGSYRAAHLVYFGRDSVNSVVRFYKRTMALPTYGWQFDRSTKIKGAIEMRFVKGREVCTVVVNENKSNPVKRTSVEVDLTTVQ